MNQTTEDDSSSTMNDSKEPLPAEANQQSLHKTINYLSFQSLTSKKKTKRLYPSDMTDRFSAFPSSWSYDVHERVSSNQNFPCCNSNHTTAIAAIDTENGTEAKSMDSDSSSGDPKDCIRMSQNADNSACENRDILFLCPAATVSERKGVATLSLESRRKPSLLDTSTDDEEEECRTRPQDRIQAPWDDEAYGSFGNISPEVTTRINDSNQRRSGSGSQLDDRQRRTVMRGLDYEDNNKRLWDDEFILENPEVTEEAIRQHSMMSVPGAIAVAGINARFSLGDFSDNHTTISMQEALRQISATDARNLGDHDESVNMELTEFIRHQSMLSVPGAIAVDGIQGRFETDADSDNETTTSMRQARRCSSNMDPNDIRVQGILAAEETDVGAFVSVSVIRQAPVIDAEGIQVINVEDDELGETDATSIKVNRWGSGLVFMVVMAALVCIVIFLIVENQQPEAKPRLASTESPTFVPTLSPTSAQLPKLIDILKSITDENILRDPSSPQFMAAEWLSRDVAEKDLTEEKQIQRYVLAIMQFAYGITAVCDEKSCTYDRSSTPFLKPYDECAWDGVTCNDDGKVTQIVLFGRPADSLLNGIVKWKQSSQKVGMLTSEIRTLTELSVLVIEGFDLSGSIDHVINPSLKNLRTIRLGGNSLTGSLPGQIWRIYPNLEVLDLSNNELSGPIPQSIGRIPSLKTLNLRKNKITGQIPSFIGLLTSLELLNLAQTLVEGSLPREIVGFSETLQTLDLSNTKMSGPLPVELELFTSLRALNLKGCDFSGTIPELSCSNAYMIRLSDNNFSGTIPSSLGQCTSLEQLKLRSNPQLTGRIPEALCGDAWDYIQQFTSYSVDCGVECDCCDFNPLCDDDW
ncbi:hypothetical protein FisN_13Lh016 [Fistulifera solaris]|uniref:Leucine-rich repeat-containing N-terminal plant-type domain-containing protein n=1 Tax=Fistulifera solaris TaxID=1519565 RepID=A0A1Z5JEY0_FISSO|nr:hypothetical protein FisN_13Lh016 [Fistulifera solaris]|eukprot:GAX12567.1 hypothetical protein FisN_13Lh016 [Fistulifera solaris]